jgi:hypothetical protein
MVDFYDTPVHVNPKPYLDVKTKDRWLKALRSRKYKQGHMVLKSRDNHYCCLGVLCEVVGLPINVNNEQSLLKDKDAAALFHCNNKQAREIQETLANKNDGFEFDGQSSRDVTPQKFYQIARWIERNL